MFPTGHTQVAREMAEGRLLCQARQGCHFVLGWGGANYLHRRQEATQEKRQLHRPHLTAKSRSNIRRTTFSSSWPLEGAVKKNQINTFEYVFFQKPLRWMKLADINCNFDYFYLKKIFRAVLTIYIYLLSLLLLCRRVNRQRVLQRHAKRFKITFYKDDP